MPVFTAARLRAARRMPHHRALLERLAQARDLPPQAAGSDRFELNAENWVRMWLDREPAWRSGCGAYRVHQGLTWDGRPLWLVRQDGKRHGYHADAPCPETALAKARAAWDERRRVRAHWPVVRRIARDLALGRRRMTVTIEDAHASALCTVGIEGFLRRIGMGRVRRISGRTAALMMALEPQVGFVILAAHERAHGRLPDPASSDHDTRGLRLA